MSEPTVSLRDALQIAYVVAILGEAASTRPSPRRAR